MSNGIETASHLVPESFFDLIARLVPGTVVLSLYFWDSNIKEVPVTVGAAGAFVGYFIGFCADVLSCCIETLLCISCLCEWRWFVKMRRSVRSRLCTMIWWCSHVRWRARDDRFWWTDTLLLESIRKHHKDKRPLLLKTMAEKAMLRSSMLLCPLVLLLPSSSLSSISLGSRICLGCLCFAGLFICYLRMRYVVTREMDNSPHSKKHPPGVGTKRGPSGP